MYRYTTKQQYKINRGKSFLLGGLMGLAALFGCEEPDNPTPPKPQPDPTDTIVIPTKEKVFDVDWNVDSYGSPSVDSIKKYADNPEYKYIFINLMNKGSPLSNGQEGCPRTSSPARGFARACDSLQTRFDVSNKVRGSGTIIVSREGGASLPDDAYDEIGMRRLDSLKLRKWGIKVERNR